MIDDDLAAAGFPPLPRTAWLAIDLDRLAANLAAFRAAVPAGVRIEPVVKADAYGHGAVAVASALERAGADGLGVATWDEALELRDAGVGLPILVLYPVPSWVAPLAARLGIGLTVGDETLLQRTLEAWAAAPHGPADAGRLRVELEVETGLGRGGIPVGRVGDVVRLIRATDGVDLAGLWSHLGDADDTRRTAVQATNLDAARELAAGGGAAVTRRHLAASGGVLADAIRTYDAIRPGLAVYGVIPDGLGVAATRATLAAALRPVMSLHARPVRVVDLPAGSGISYGSTFVTERASRIATLPLGYADGYQRARTGRAHVLIRGVSAAIVGTIAMDAVMVDVTDVPGEPVSVDDEFVLLGEQGTGTIAAVELARVGTTISWEVLAAMSRRLPRVYYAAAQIVGVRTLTGAAAQRRDVPRQVAGADVGQ